MSVTAAPGFRAAGVEAGLKPSGQRDLALLVNDGPAQGAAGVFTTNRVKAAPVLWSQQVLAGGRVSAVLLNSGGANAATGPPGFQDTHASAERVAATLDLSAAEVAVASTGRIGERLPMAAVLGGIETAAGQLQREGGTAAADAIRTTDTVPKTASRQGSGYTVGGMAKGAGMVAPEMATMLCVLTTDADLGAGELDAALRPAAATTFERVDTDGCLSTNDTVLLLSSGASGVAPATGEFADVLRGVCTDLTRQLVADAEGASKEISVEVVRAASEDDAVEVARAVARSNLVKCALHGHDPNWGRILAAVGTTSAAFEPDRVALALNGTWVCRGGMAAEDRAKVDLAPRGVTITVDLAAGEAAATVDSADLTAAYVHENAAYST